MLDVDQLDIVGGEAAEEAGGDAGLVVTGDDDHGGLAVAIQDGLQLFGEGEPGGLEIIDWGGVICASHTPD